MAPRKDPFKLDDQSTVNAKQILEPLAQLYRCVCALQDQISTLQSQTIELKNAIESRQAHVENIRLAAKRRGVLAHEPKFEEL